MHKTLKIFLIGIPLSFLIAIIAASIAYYDEATSYQKRPEVVQAKSDANDALNTIVNSCTKLLPNGDQMCDENLSYWADRACDRNPEFDACSDGRVNHYKAVRDIEAADAFLKQLKQ